MDINSFMLSIPASGKTPPDAYSPLVLAYLGDAVFELINRARTVSAGNAPVNTLSNETARLSNAAAQSAFYGIIEPRLTEEETAVLKRGRNAKSCSRAKNAKVSDYRRATGVEALFGYLFLNGRTSRLLELFSMIDKSEEGGTEK